MRLSQRMVTVTIAALMTLAHGVSPVWADQESGYGEHGGGYEKGGHGMGMGMMMHGGTSHLIKHLFKHQQEIGLNDEQVGKLKDIQLNLDKTRIKMEADIQVAERELRALVEDEKSDMGAIENKLKQSADQQVALRVAAIKARREALAVLTPDQRSKEKAEHDKAMQEHRGRAKGHGDPHKGMKKDN